jgi:hypothetical protein
MIATGGPTNPDAVLSEMQTEEVTAIAAEMALYAAEMAVSGGVEPNKGATGNATVQDFIELCETLQPLVDRDRESAAE